MYVSATRHKPVVFEEHEHAHGTAARDNNMRAAFIHVIADAAVSVLVIVGLSFARAFGWLWMDPLAGIVGACVIASWSFGLVRDTGAVLLDMNPDRRMAEKLRQASKATATRSPICISGGWGLAISARCFVETHEARGQPTTIGPSSRASARFRISPSRCGVPDAPRCRPHVPALPTVHVSIVIIDPLRAVGLMWPAVLQPSRYRMDTVPPFPVSDHPTACDGDCCCAGGTSRAAMLNPVQWR